MVQAMLDVMLHPVRMQIIQTLVNKRGLSAQELGERLPTVPQATLYRHLNTLLDAGMLQATEERTGSGHTERIFTMSEDHLTVSPDELAQISPADHMRYFMTFVAGLANDFSRYLKRSDIDFHRDGVGYRQTVLNLTDEELEVLIRDLNARMRRDEAKERGSGRTPRVITRIVMPGEHPEETA